jgi:hypothetical protein
VKVIFLYVNNFAGLKMGVQIFMDSLHLSSFLTQRKFDSELYSRITCLQKSLVLTYEVKAKYKGAISVKGVCAKIYQEAQLHQAIYSIKNPESVWYSGDDLQLDLMFKSEENALKFQTFLSMWHINNPIVVDKGAVSVVEELEEVYIYKSELKYVQLAHYDGQDSGSPVGSLEQFKGSQASLSVSELTGASLDTHFSQLQSIEKEEEFLLTCSNPYCCHIKGQKAFPALKNDNNNMLALSWLLHQYFDGLNVVDEPSGQHKVPQIAINYVSRHFTEEMVGIPSVKRRQVTLTIECRTITISKVVGARLKLGSEKISDLMWKTFVHVENPDILCDCLEWKYARTKKQWEEVDIDDNEM